MNETTTQCWASDIPIGSVWRSSSGRVVRVKRVVDWTKNKMGFRLEVSTTSTFKSYDYLSEEKWRDDKFVPADDFYLSAEAIDEALSEIDDEAYPLRKQIKVLEEQLRAVESKKRPIQDRCEHKWQLVNEEEGKNTILGREVRTEHECATCLFTKSGCHYQLG